MTYKDWAVADFRSLSGSPPLKYESPTLNGRGFAIKITNSQARNTWRFAGWLNLLSLENFFESGLVIRQQKLTLNSIYLIHGSDNDYHKLNIDFPRWFNVAEVVVWQANTSDATEAIAAIASGEKTLNQVEIDLEKIKIDLSTMINPFNR